MPRRALLIVNDKSRSGALMRDKAVSALETYGIEAVPGVCTARDDLSPCIVAHRDAVDFVAVAGGDGTLNAAAAGLAETGLPLGLLPAGTANDLARTLGIPIDTAQAAAIIAGGHLRAIDLGLVNDCHFFNVASVGLSADLARTLTRDIKRRFGKLGYAIAALGVLARARTFRAQITSSEDPPVRVSTLQVAVGNGRYYGGGMTVAASAAIDDGHLDLYSLEFTKAWKLGLMAKSFRYGEHGAWKEVRAVRAPSFEVRTRRPRPVNADGEIVTQTPARFSLLRHAVQVYAPPVETAFST
jgi:diacylglycerol kinase (ATP)